MILNLEYNTVALILKALNKSDRIYKAAEACGISTRGMFIYIKRYDLRKNKVTKKWECYSSHIKEIAAQKMSASTHY